MALPPDPRKLAQGLYPLTGQGALPRRPISAVSLLALCLGLAACGSMSLLPPPTADLPGRYAGQASDRLVPAPEVDAAQAQWWKGFKDPVLEALITRALSGNVTLKIAEARLAEAEAQARSARFPFSDSFSASSTFYEASTTDSRTLSVSVPTGGKLISAGAAAGARIASARAAQADARLQLLGQIARSYIDLRYLQAEEAQARADLASRRKSEASLKARMDLGAGTRLDLLSAAALVAETEARIPTASAQVTAAEARLATLLGQPAGTLGIDLSWTGRQPRLAGPKDFGIPADLIRRRPDIAKAEADYAQAVAEVGQTRAAFFPSLSLSGTISGTRGFSPSQNLGLGLALPLLSLPRVAAEQDAAMARAEQAYLTWRLAVLSAVEEVEAGIAGVSGARSAAARQARAVEINAQALDLSRKLMEGQGDVTALALLDRERAVAASRAALAQAYREEAAQVVALYVALGLGLDPV